MKTYTAHVQFHAIGIQVKADSKAEARRKIWQKVRRRKITGLVDRGNLFIDRQP